MCGHSLSYETYRPADCDGCKERIRTREWWGCKKCGFYICDMCWKKLGYEEDEEEREDEGEGEEEEREDEGEDEEDEEDLMSAFIQSLGLTEHVSYSDALHHCEILTGTWQQRSKDCREMVSVLVKKASAFWIGIASSDKAKSRWNNKYKGLGMNRIALVYKTKSDTFRKKMETDLIQHFLDQSNSRCRNVRLGGAGCEGSPPYYVYVAWKE